MMTDGIISGACGFPASMPCEAEAARDEDKEDSAILQDWLQRRAADAVETLPLDELERELLPDE